jgi:hypothetical protein
MIDDTMLPFCLPSVRRKKLTVDFAGGNQSSAGGLLLLREAERKLGVCRRLAEAMPDRRDPDRVRHAMFEMVMARASAIACGYEDAMGRASLGRPRTHRYGFRNGPVKCHLIDHLCGKNLKRHLVLSISGSDLFAYRPGAELAEVVCEHLDLDITPLSKIGLSDLPGLSATSSNDRFRRLGQ